MSKAEAEELTNMVGCLTAENAALKAEIDQLMEDSDNLRHENAKLMVSSFIPFIAPFLLAKRNCEFCTGCASCQEKLKHSKAGGTGEEGSDTEVDEILPITTENLLSRVDNVSPSEMSTDQEEEAYEQKVQNSNTGSELRQLLATKPRADAVAAT